MYESEKIRQAIKEAGFTQAEIARRMGIKQPTFNSFVTGKNRPTLRTLKRIAQITGKELSFFLAADIDTPDLKTEIMFLHKEIENLKHQVGLLKEDKK